ncbi:signal peptidase I [Altericista sp. CCNU0014]|uniref:signal peptidase I n=1 Tax=Altericista sp. CCNU0014 TaxID=3082949 RepID=UPI00384FE011
MAKSSQEESWWLEAAKTVGLSLLLAFGIRTYVAEARWIPSGSMEPTLQINDRLIVEKISYYFRDPERGDVVVFNPTQALKSQGFHDAFIKRVIGIPGDRVEIKDGSVYVNGRRLSESYVANGDSTLIEACGNVPGNSDREPPLPFLAKPVIIPKESVLVLGDNRSNSYDGRCWGLVKKEEVVGRASFRFWPIGRTGTLPDFHPTFTN